MIRSLTSLQVLESHVVFQSFSDLYEVEQRQSQSQSRRASSSSSTSKLAPLRSKVPKTSASRSSSRRSSTTTSSVGSSAADAESTYGFHDLSRSSSRTTMHTYDDEHEHVNSSSSNSSYLAALYDSKVEARLRSKEADIETLYDEPLSFGGKDEASALHGQDLSLKRFPPRLR